MHRAQGPSLETSHGDSLALGITASDWGNYSSTDLS